MSGGGAFGPVQVGMLRALTERDVRPDLVVGTSVGALHGALLAAADSTATEQVVEQMATLWRTMDRRAVFGRRRRVPLSLLRHRTLADQRALARIIERNLPIRHFEDLRIPFAAVATDALSGEPRLLTAGSLIPALLASSAVPGVFPPVAIEGRTFVDGGVAANVPIRQALAFGARSVVSLDATPALVAERVPTSLIGSLIHSAALMLRNQQSHAVDGFDGHIPVATMPSATPPDMGTFNFKRTDELLDLSHRNTSDALDTWVDDELTAT